MFDQDEYKKNERRIFLSMVATISFLIGAIFGIVLIVFVLKIPI